jgi:tripartite-type tricarboxylate transporter receptor subunit TctC
LGSVGFTAIAITLYPAMPDIHLACDSFSSAWEQAKADRISVLAVTSAKRYSFAPDIPTIAETVKGLEVQAWFGWIAPIGVPKSFSTN